VTIFGQVLGQLPSILSGGSNRDWLSSVEAGNMDDKADLLLGAASLVFVLGLVLALAAEVFR
jgi:hypothetical protein